MTLSEKVVIYGYPRCGTKLLASILQSKGYHNYGEYFDTFTSTVVNDSAVRNSAESIREKYSATFLNTDHAAFADSGAIMNRFASTDFNAYPKSTVTVWHENLVLFPHLIHAFADRTWILPRRDAVDQLFSWLVVFYNNNPSGDISSKPIHVEKKTFTRLYYKQQIVLQFQDWLSRNYASTVVDFDRLINGTAQELGDYTVTSKDEHSDPRKWILNINQVQQWLGELKQQDK